jgi:ankyrin repeat protein
MNNEEAFNLLIDNSDVNILDNNGNNSLFIAIINNSFNFIEKILNYNINLNILNKNSHSILLLAILYNYNNIEIFINKDKNLNLNIINDIYYSTPIMFSIVRNNDIVTDILIKYNVDLNIQDNIGYTCFHYAIFNNNYKFFKNIDNLNNINLLNIDNSTILHIIYNKYLYDDNRFNYPLEKLIKKTNLNIKDKYNTILHYLILSNDWIKFKDILI